MSDFRHILWNFYTRQPFHIWQRRTFDILGTKGIIFHQLKIINGTIKNTVQQLCDRAGNDVRFENY